MTTILIVDDEPNVRDALEAVLETFDYTVLLAENGKEGLASFNQHNPDLVLTDLVMPVMSGIDMIYAIRMADKDKPIIAISGGGGGAAAADILEEATHAGATKAMHKPVLTEELRDAVSSLLKA